MPIEKTRSYFGRGWEAGKAGLPDTTNPFPHSSFENEQWNDGWRAAMSGKHERKDREVARYRKKKRW